TSTINHTLANSSLANALIIQQKAGLAEVLDQILALSDEPDRINQINVALEKIGSRLCVIKTDAGNYSVVDDTATAHSLEEVLWSLSF
ncbi:MAG: hypothetical protein K6G23_04515, partial [Lachnospiraceae bacterium]|nr:hypothetical protein [Lachnospiraceae bacterium]